MRNKYELQRRLEFYIRTKKPISDPLLSLKFIFSASAPHTTPH